jgi:predicted TIM-barrel fold metal-dependent hydrolase
MFLTLSYFEYTDVDKCFYRQHLAERLPAEISDIHVHMYLPEHVKNVPEDHRFKTWAAECSQVLGFEDARAYTDLMYPGTKYEFAGLPMVTPEGDSVGNNSYLAALESEGKLLAAFMAVRPEWDAREIEKTLVESRFVGFKPYLTMATDGRKGDSGIFSFLPHEQWEILNRHRKALMLHLPRKDRFADDDNIKELLLARDKYPDVRIIIAHLGRSYNPYFLEEGLRKLGDPGSFFFDTTAVINPEVYDLAFSEIPLDNIFYGSDLHVLLWHGRREWDGKTYHNLCREDFSWNTDRRPAEEEKQYTLFLYEQMRAILDACDRHTLSDTQKQNIFSNNARRLLEF